MDSAIDFKKSIIFGLLDTPGVPVGGGNGCDEHVVTMSNFG
jgi:hypothetical protein